MDEEEGGAMGRDAVEDDTVEREGDAVEGGGDAVEGRELCHTGNKVYHRMH